MFTTKVPQLMSFVQHNGKILMAIESMEAAEMELGLPVSVEYVGIHNEVEKLLKMNPVLLR